LSSQSGESTVGDLGARVLRVKKWYAGRRKEFDTARRDSIVRRSERPLGPCPVGGKECRVGVGGCGTRPKKSFGRG
jgi:hypothetical protein